MTTMARSERKVTWKPSPCAFTPNKATWRNQSAAQHAANRINRDNAQAVVPLAKAPLHPYPCGCGQWHLSREAPR